MCRRHFSATTVFLLIFGLIAMTGATAMAQSPLERLKKRLPGGKETASDNNSSAAAKDEYKTLASHGRSLAINLINDIERDSISERRDVVRLYVMAERLDYPNTKRKLEEGVVKYPDLAKDHSVKDFLQGIPSQFMKSADLLLSSANAFIEKAYQRQSRNRVEAAEFAESARMYADIVLWILPDNAGALAVKRDAEAAAGKVGGALAASTYTGPFHKANAGKIIFFNLPPTVKQESPSSIATEFKAGDHIYAVAYLRGSLKELVHLTSRESLGGLRYRLFIDGNEHIEYGGFPARISWETYQDAATTYLKIDVVPDPDAIDYSNPFQYDPAIKYTRLLGQASPRRHRIELKLEAESKIIADGAFAVDLSSGQEKLLATAEALHKEKISKVFLPKPQMTNAALQQSMLQALKANGWKQELLRVVITAPDWRIHRTPLGAIDFRSIAAAVAMKEPDGRCRYFSLSFKQAYQGGGYGRTQQYGVGDNLEMACANVNK